MGAALAEAAAARGADVTLVAGPDTPAVPGARRIDFETAADLERALADLAPRADAVVMAAAVADFRPRAPVAGKLSRRTAGDANPGTLGGFPDPPAMVRGEQSSPAPHAFSLALEAVPGARRIDFETAADLERALSDLAPRADAVVMAAAVADFRPRAPLAGKLSRRTTGSEVSLALEAVPDLLAGLARARRGARPYLVGFAAETAAGDALVERAGAKLREKRCDAIVANDVSGAGIGFGSDDNEVTLLFGDGERHALARAPKRVIADRLWDLLAGRLPPREAPHA